MADVAAPASVASAATAAARSRVGIVAALGVMTLSGAAALGYEIVWTQQNALWLGHESAAVLAVLTAFFGGLALGSILVGRYVERSERPFAWYAACELAIAMWAVALAAALPELAPHLLRFIGPEPGPLRQWTITFAVTFALLLPATLAMGATMPVMDRVMRTIRPSGAGIGALYAANTLGAMLGVVVAAFWLIPAVGLEKTALVCGAANVACAAWALAKSRERVAAGALSMPRFHAGIAVLAATGLLGIGYEVVAVRVLSQVSESTVYTFAVLLAVYLGGTALGATAHHRWFAARPAPEKVRMQLLLATSAACILGTLAMAAAPALRIYLAGVMPRTTLLSALVGEGALALAAFLLPTIAMGALFAHLCAVVRSRGVPFAWSLGVNTLGAALAPIFFGVVLIPAIGLKGAALVVPMGYLLLAARQAIQRHEFGAVVIAALVAALLVWMPGLAVVDVPPGGRAVALNQGSAATVSVVEDADGVATLHIDNHQQEGSSATVLADSRQALLPLLMHPAPRRVLFLGLGTGVTASAAAQDLQLRVDAAELLPEVIDASAYFRRAFDGTGAADRLHLVRADARRYVRTASARYDVIVADNFHPARSGSGTLYTVEHFAAVHERLGEDGLFCQWLPLHQLDLESLRSIVASFRAVFPGAVAVLATNSLETPIIGLVGRRGDARIDADAVRRRVGSLTVPGGAARFGFEDELAVIGAVFAGPGSLGRFAAGAPLNTDDRPVVAYTAPRITYVADSRPRDRLLALAKQLDVEPSGVLAGPVDGDVARRYAAYWVARNRFLEAGRDVRPAADPRQMLAQVREPLLDVLRTSPDFRPAYDPLVAMAGALAQFDPDSARELLGSIQRLQPARPEAGKLLEELGR